jgi:hypothetical protein
LFNTILITCEQEQSFKEFAMRPENRALLEQHQREEVAAALQLQEQMQDLNLQQQVGWAHCAAGRLWRSLKHNGQFAQQLGWARLHNLGRGLPLALTHPCAPQQVSELHPADQNLLAPVLKSAVLRQLLTAMSAAPQPGAEPTAGGDSSAAQLGVWLANPRVLQLLREAAKALRKGLLTEEQLVVLLQQEVKVRPVWKLGHRTLVSPLSLQHERLYSMLQAMPDKGTPHHILGSSCQQ